MIHLFTHSKKASTSTTITITLRHLSASLPPPSAALSTLLQGRIPTPHLLQIHARVFRLNLHQDNLIATRLIGHYPSKHALNFFNILNNPNIFPFNAIIRVLSEQGPYDTAFSIFKNLKNSIFSPNDLTFSFLLKACAKASNGPVYVNQIQTHVVKFGFIDDLYVCNGLLFVYAKGLKDLVVARKLFDEMPDKSVICCWTNLISGYAVSGQSEKALELFCSMVKDNLQPENDTMVSVLSACSSLEAAKVERWVKVFDELGNDHDREKLVGDNVNVVLVYLYGKQGKFDESRERFDRISIQGKRSVLSWNVMIGAYVQNGCYLEGLSLYRLMMEEYDCIPNHVTMVYVLSACAHVGDIDIGTRVHSYLRTKEHRGVLFSNKNLATALIDMYYKCGNVEKARDVFGEIRTKDIVLFNAMIMGLAVNGKGEAAFSYFSEIQELGLHPDAATFLGLLCACSHSGLLEKGRQVFKDMISKFKISPKLEHYASYIDLLARVGCIKEAMQVVSSMPFEPNQYVWGALLSGSLLHDQSDIAQIASSMLLKSDPGNSGGYVMLSNSFASDNRWGDVSGVRGFMRDKGVTKHPGCSWIGIYNMVHEFVAGSTSHPNCEVVHSRLEELIKEMKIPSL
ncbi:hypothetical protein LIER_15418 [Lithospermum erythrorhizon]|uniref:Pentatricopeptide repeat-containing protein n=1 Tax=Lithospermum erythrorhizon TaxID=34254 RepID=A0AAV3Q565_LITER